MTDWTPERIRTLADICRSLRPLFVRSAAAALRAAAYEIERLRADERRLDWLERSHHNIEREDDEDGVHRVWCGPSHIAAGSVREAIDAAMGGGDRAEV